MEKPLSKRINDKNKYEISKWIHKKKERIEQRQNRDEKGNATDKSGAHFAFKRNQKDIQWN